MEKEIKEEVFNNLGREIQMLSMGVSLIIDEYKKIQESGETEISSDLKEKIVLTHNTMNDLAKSYAASHFDNKDKNKTNVIREKNEKIEELKNQLGEKVKENDITYYLSKIQRAISEKGSETGLFLYGNVSANEYGIEIVFDFLSGKEEETRYAKDEDEVERIKNDNFIKEKALRENFDISEKKEGRDTLIRMTQRNIDSILDIVNEASGLDFEVHSFSNGRFSPSHDILRELKLFYNTSEPLSLQMYYGD
jgi:aminopeptidase N